MKLGTSKLKEISAVSLLLILLANSTAFALTAGQHLSSPTNSSPSPLSEGDSHTTTWTHSSTGTHTEDGNQSGDGSGDNQNETGGQNQDGQNETSSGSGVENDTSGLQEDQNLTGSNELHFSLVGVNGSVPGRGHANIQFEGLDVQVSAHVSHALNNTTYQLFMVINGTSHLLGTMVTDHEGEGEIEAGTSLSSAGPYTFGVTLNVGSTPSLIGSPSNQGATIGSSSSHEGEDNQGDGQHDSVSVHDLSPEASGVLGAAQASGQIPGVVFFDGNNARATVNDNKFSIGAGRLTADGLSISITGNNVVGSRILMVDLTNSYDFSKNGLRLTFDGQQVSQGSLAQVMAVTPSDKPVFVVLGAPSGYTLLVGIPHFSTHSILITPVAIGALQGLFQVSGFALVATMLAIGAAVLVFYTRRTVYTTLA